MPPTAPSETVAPDAYQTPGNASPPQQATSPPAGEPSVPSGQTGGETLTCTLGIECASIFSHLSELDESKLAALPPDGVILPESEVSFEEGETVWSVLQRVCRERNVPLEASFTPVYGSVYVEGIGHLYEFDCGELSGWMYEVNGWYPNYGCSLYELHGGDAVRFRYTCELGEDIGGGSALR